MDEPVLIDLINGGNLPGLVDSMSFHQARLGLIARNVANMHTPGYRAGQLDVAGFQGALRKAFTQRGSNSTVPWRLEGGSELQTDEAGRLQVKPSFNPVENLLFHDGTNVSIEHEMSELAQAGMMHDLAAQLLRAQFEGLRKAIRGRQ